MNIYVGNLPYSVRDDQLRARFEEFGKVDSAEVIIDRRRNRSRGYGFVVMSDEHEARAAIAALDGADMQGRSLRVDESRPKSRGQSARRGRAGAEQGAQRRARPAAGARQDQPRARRGGLLGFLRRLFG